MRPEIDYLPFDSEFTNHSIVIEWADILIMDSNYLGLISLKYVALTFEQDPPDKLELEHSSLKMRDFILKDMNVIDGDISPLLNILNEYRKMINNHFLNEGYIESPSPASGMCWYLSERGKLVKELGGHFRYKKYRKNEINALQNQRRINYLLICATFLAGFMPFVIARFAPNKIVVNNIPIQQLSQADSQLIYKHFTDQKLKSPNNTSIRK